MDSEKTLRKRHKREGRQSAGLENRLELASEILLCAVLVLCPWLFGTTEPWSIRLINLMNYGLGALLACKIALRWRSNASGNAEDVRDGSETRWSWVKWVPPAGAVLLLAYTAVAAWNARAIYITDEQRFEYLTFIPWLPHSYDRMATLERLFRMLGAACFFFALTDWLSNRRGGDSPAYLSQRTKRLLWVICLNGTLLAVEGILQRLSKTNKLLWLIQPELHIWWTVQFGTYAYRSNAAQLFNLIWPVTLGFFLALQRELRQGFGKGPETLLVLFCAVMAICPILTSSRLGAGVMALLMCGCLVWVGRLNGRKGWKWTAFLASCLLILVSAGVALNWKHLSRRLEKVDLDGLNLRSEIYVNAQKMAADYPVFGVGPGAFGAVYQLYRDTPDQYWHAYAHDDWLEARVTFGLVGSTLIILMLASVLIPPLFGLFAADNGGWLGFLYLSASGMLVTAFWDLPFQVYSILLYFLTVLGLISKAWPRYSRK